MLAQQAAHDAGVNAVLQRDRRNLAGRLVALGDHFHVELQAVAGRGCSFNIVCIISIVKTMPHSHHRIKTGSPATYAAFAWY